MDDLIKLLEKFPKKTLINIMIASLDEMQSYNGQSITSAVCRALDAEETDGPNGVSWKLPPVNKIKKAFV